MIAVPSPFQQKELLVLGTNEASLRRVRTDAYHADLIDKGAQAPLTLDAQQGRDIIAEFLERALVVAFERDTSFWRLFSSTRYWYHNRPVAVVDGVQVVPRISFATVSLGAEGVGVAFDSGHLYRTDMTVADFYANVGRSERQERIRRFERLRTRGERRKGTLLYDTCHDAVSVCYFERFEEGITCDSTGPIQGKDSLYEYCREKHPEANIRRDDSVACVSFPSANLRHPVLVPARLLRLRIMPDRDQSIRGLGQYKTSPPTSRREQAIRAWNATGSKAARSVGVTFEKELWRPSQSEMLPCPPLTFGKGRTVAAPANGGADEYKRYFRQRLEKLKGGGLYHYDEAVERRLHLVTPKTGGGWTDELQTTFVSDFSAAMKDIAGQQFRVAAVREDDPEKIVETLGETNPGSTVIVFDDRAADNAAYFLLAHGLPGWKLKRLTRRQVQD
ncbi:MAG: hypothetical protein K2V38_12005, partial [Gemmataceae bacterium]|nr:hypothetical protein [Gemmataceae bacterium]